MPPGPPFFLVFDKAINGTHLTPGNPCRIGLILQSQGTKARTCHTTTRNGGARLGARKHKSRVTLVKFIPIVQWFGMAPSCGPSCFCLPDCPSQVLQCLFDSKVTFTPDHRPSAQGRVIRSNLLPKMVITCQPCGWIYFT